ncbi:hypothetical protein PG996_014251 [Apiospora saccharicola]|uniref:Uncharacterized protein n=1 Tax=Apiospora saccharicola TaxID=335842 RepID=A0ABR1THZ5_9PEZI
MSTSPEDRRNTSPETITDHPSPNSRRNIWNIPGLDNTSFYAAALYLHVAAKGQLRDAEHHGRHHQPKTKRDFRDFLDRLADCFARSKDKDAQAHVSATGMVLDEQQRRITVYVAKNVSGKDLDRLPSSPRETALMVSEDAEFAQKLCNWFNKLSCDDGNVSDHLQGEMWDAMRKYNASRVKHYARRVGSWKQEGAEDVDTSIWPSVPPGTKAAIKTTIDECMVFRQDPPPSGQVLDKALDECALAASKCRSDPNFHQFSLNVDEIINNDNDQIDEAFKEFAKAVKSIDYLGRLGDTYNTFRAFCKASEQQGYTYDIVVLKSPTEESHDLDKFIASRASRGTARVHCEIQLLHHFFQQDSPKPLDYIGCSKKSCWLCWQLLGHFGQFTTKDTHRMIYPMWAYPADFPPAADSVLGIKAFTSNWNISHTSRRHNQSMAGEVDSVPELSVVASSSADSIMSSVHIRDQGRVPVTSVPVIHLPATSSEAGGAIPSPQVIEVELFECDEEDPQEQEPSMLIKAVQGHHHHRNVLFPFQINTKTLEPGNSLREITLEDLEMMLWGESEIPCVEGNQFYYMMFRMDGDLERNPWLLDMTRSSQGTAARDAKSPWFGDVFIYNRNWSSIDEETVELCMDSLRQEFKNEYRCLQDSDKHERRLIDAWGT